MLYITQISFSCAVGGANYMRLVYLMFITDSDLSLYQTVGIRVPIQTVSDFHSFTAVFSHTSCLLRVHQPQIPFAKILIYLGSKWLHLITFKSNFVMAFVAFYEFRFV
jgi:hypothetical protein